MSTTGSHGLLHITLGLDCFSADIGPSFGSAIIVTATFFGSSSRVALLFITADPVWRDRSVARFHIQLLYLGPWWRVLRERGAFGGS